MVLETILRAWLTLLPCLVFGLIMIISFLLCNCEYIGETMAKHFCAWKDRRKARIKSSRKQSEKNDANTSGPATSKTLSINSAHNYPEKALKMSSPFQRQPCHSQNVVANEKGVIMADSDSNVSATLNCANASTLNFRIDNDPPPSYEDFLNSKKKK